MASGRITGLKELGDAMRGLKEEVNLRLCRQATAAGAAVIKDKAKKLAPVAPAEVTPKIPYASLRDSIVVTHVKGSKFTSEHLVAVLGGHKHDFASHVAALQEFGTVYMSPQPFMRPAFDVEKGHAAGVVRDKLKAGIERAVAKLGRK